MQGSWAGETSEHGDWLEGPIAISNYKLSCQRTPCMPVPRAPNPEAAWTTARCNRLLRPLSSKISGLRRLKKLGSLELEISHPDCAGILSDAALPKRRQARSHWTHHRSHDTGLLVRPPPPCGPRSLGIRSQDSATDSSPSDSEVDPWSDVLGEGRARKRLRRTYEIKRARADREWRVRNPPTQAQAASIKAMKPILIQPYADALALTRPGKPNVASLIEGGGGTLGDLGFNEAPGLIDPDLTLPGDFHSCTRRLGGEFRELAKFMYPLHWKLADGIWENLEALLRVTSPDQSPKQGASSLFEICLKRMATYVAEEKVRVTNDEPDDSSDIATAVYDDLEALSTSGKAGWRPLKSVVRAHAIRLIATAVQESVVGLPIARGLVILCLHREAYSEAQVILESMLCIMKPLPKPRSIENKLFALGQSITLHTLGLLRGTNGLDSLAFTYRQLAALWRKGVLPLEWIACKDLVELWNRVVISITQGDADAPDAAILLRVVISLMYGNKNDSSEHIEQLRSGEWVHDESECHCGSPQSFPTPEIIATYSIKGASGDVSESPELGPKAAKTVTNILTVLASVAILQKPEWTVLQDIGTEARQVQEFVVPSSAHISEVKVDSDQLGLTLLAVELIKTPSWQNSQSPSGGMISHDLYHSATTEFCTIAGSFVSNVACCCGKAVGQDPFIHLQNLLKNLNHPSLGQSQKLYESISLAAAFIFAEQTNHQEHLQWALDFERKVAGGIAGQIQRSPNRTPADRRQSHKNGYRWEEGICEWVAKTPAATLSDLKQDNINGMEADKRSSLDNATRNASSSEESDGSVVSPCLKKRKRGFGGHEQTAKHGCVGQVCTHTNEQCTEEVNGLDAGQVPQKYPGDDIEDLYNDQDELSVLTKSFSSQPSQRLAAASPDPQATCNTHFFHPADCGDWPPQSKRAKMACQKADVAVSDHATQEQVKARRVVEESEDELSFS